MTTRSRPSVLSRFRLAGVGVMVGMALVGAVFYAAVNSHYLAMVLSRTLGPYSDSLSEHVFTHRDPELWRRIAQQHDVALLVETSDGEVVGFDPEGLPVTASDMSTHTGIVAVRTADDGTRVTIHWRLWSFRESHFPLLTGLLIMVVTVVGSAFWFLQKQLQPLAWLQRGVEAVGRGDFATRVPVVRDDEIGRVGRAFNDMAERVGTMVDDRERLLADVSHELRSPVARMKVALELMPEGGKRDSLARDLKEMESLIRGLLEREELRSRVGPLAGEEVDLRSLAREVCADLAGRDPGVDVAEGAPVRVRADPTLCRRLVHNLVDNGLKFSRPDSRPVRVVVQADGEGAVSLHVLDDGVGVPDEDAERVFEPFVKLNRSRGHGLGYGLGLNLCRRIMELHGGSIRLEPGTPRGTLVVASFPPEG